ncbi:MAG: ytcD 2 [Proteobacteria bacterium]|nr:ytcD 2 [Pseudomonadota bacterium]
MSVDLGPEPTAASGRLNCSVELQEYLSVVQRGLKAITGKWKGEILCLLSEGPKRFNELRRGIPGVTQHMLAAQLRDLEKSGLIVRHDYEQAPPRVEYELSEAGKALRTVGDALHDWAKTYAPEPESGQS